MIVSVTVEDAQLRRMIRFGDKYVRQGAAKVLTRTGRSIRQRASKGTAASLRVPWKVVNRRLYARRATSRHLVSIVTAYTRPINPGPLAAGGSQGPATFYGRSWPTGFVMTTQTGKRLVAVRKAEAKTSTGKDFRKRPRRDRLPVQAQKINVEVVAEPIIRKVTARLANKMLNNDLPREVLYRLRKAAKG